MTLDKLSIYTSYMKFSMKNKIKNQILVKPIVLIGAGQLGKMTLDLWPMFLPKPIYFLDSFKSGNIDGIPIYQLSNHTFNDAYCYVLSIVKGDTCEIQKLFQNINQEIITAYDLLTILDSDSFSNGWFGNFLTFIKIRNMRKFFFDQESLDAIDHISDWRCKRKLSNKPALRDEKYKYSVAIFSELDLAKSLNRMDYDYVFDCGSYDLNLLKSMIGEKVNFKKYVALEPDHLNAYRIEEIIMEQKLNLSKIHLEKVALTDEIGTTKFISNGLLSARVIAKDSNKSVTEVSTTSIQDIFRKYGVTTTSSVFLKIHIEGSEYKAIKGAIEILSKMKNLDIVINLSHDKESLLRIPRILKKLDYSIKILLTAYFGEGAYLYATNRTR